MDCRIALQLAEAYLDGEMDRDGAREFEAHVDACAECRNALARLDQVRRALRTEAPRHSAPAALRARIRAETAQRARSVMPSRRLPAWWGMAAACVIAFAAGGAVFRLWTPPSDAAQQVQRDLFASHWRALAATSPVDVVSSDRHTVKPWFAGKLAQAPLVVDLADQGFPLVGGRIDYVGSERVPVLVYRHGSHLIDVFVLARDANNAVGTEVRRQGYALEAVPLGDQLAIVVSDLDEQELSRFGQLLRAAK